MKNNLKLTLEEIKAAAYLALRNKDIDPEYRKNIEESNYQECGKAGLMWLKITCYICNQDVVRSTVEHQTVDSQIEDDVIWFDWYSHIRNHLKDIKIFI